MVLAGFIYFNIDTYYYFIIPMRDEIFHLFIVFNVF